MSLSAKTPNGTTAARFIAAAAGRQYAPEVLAAAKMCLVDYMGVALGAHNDEAAVAVRATAESWQARGKARVLLGGRTAPALAALVNGTMAHCMDYDDTHASGAGHLSAPTWSTALALAEDRGLSERDALHAFITGFEVAARLGGGGNAGMGRNLQLRGIHPTSVSGRFGAAAVACAMMGLDEHQAANALGVAATTAGGLNASFGTMSKPFHAGKAAMDGILAAQLAAEGFQAATHLLDADNGLAGAFVQDGSVKFEAVEYTPGHTLLTNTFKPYACGKLIHGHIDAARSLADAVKGRRIERIRASVAPNGLNLVGRANPRTPLEAKFSVAFGIALGLRGHLAVATDYSQARLDDPEIRAIVHCVEAEVNHAVGHYGSILDVELEGGERLHAEVAESLGNPGNPLDWDGLELKFIALVEPVLPSQAHALLAALRTFEQPGRLAEVMNIVAEPPHG